MKHKPTIKEQSSILPFPAWVEKTYPKKTPIRSFLQMIGALDMAYMMYRMGTKMTKSPRSPTIKKTVTQPHIPSIPLVVEDHKKIEEDTEPELNIEFHQQPEAVHTHASKPVEEKEIEPEPLELHADTISANTQKEQEDIWLDSPSLEDIDIRKTQHVLSTRGITFALEQIYGSDEEETAIVIQGTSWRAFLASPVVNLSKMLQIARVSHGELYILGRMALGAMSGEGYITSEELTNVMHTLAQTTGNTCEIEVQYYDKEKTAKKRTAHTIHIRFQRV